MSPDHRVKRGERDAADALLREVACGRVLQTINFHATPLDGAARLDRQLAWVAERFSTVTPADLDEAFENGAWKTPRQPIVLALFNGFGDNYSVARPLLEKHGLIGWFFVVTEWLGVAPSEQLAYAQARGMRVPAASASARSDGRVALDWDEVRELSRRHVIASHTRTHARIGSEDSNRLRSEIVGSQEDLRSKLGQSVVAFAWLQGAAYGNDPKADKLLLDAGYRYLVSNLRLQRLP